MNTGGSPSIGMRAYLMSTPDIVAALLKRNNSRGVFVCVCAFFLNISHLAHCLHPLSTRQSAVILLQRTSQNPRKDQVDVGEY